MSRKPKLLTRILQYTFLVLMTIFALYPIWFVILASGRLGGRLYTLNLLGMFIPLEFTFENYRIMISGEAHPFLSWMRNSLFVAGFTTLACMLVATSAAFAFSRFRFYGREFGLVLLLAIQAFPGVLSLVPVAQMLTAMQLYANLWGLVLAYVVGNLVFTTWLLKGYFDTIPIEIEEAAMIDGCGPIQSFLLVGVPMAKPALAVTALLAFMGGWGEFVFASVLIPAPDAKRTLMVGMYSIANSMSIPWGYFAAGAVMTIIPVIIVYTYFQKYLVGGLTLGGVKG
ncbi:MAG: sugar ABC transporter permease [Anaerolineales bacterium]|nr:sugar ABC transporter permease [Anaerolineales bacterium]